MNPTIENQKRSDAAPAPPRSPSPSSLLLRYLVGNQVQQAIHVAAELGIADALAQGPLSADELAARVDARADPLRRLLETLASFGIFARGADGHFTLTPMASLLREGTPDSLRPFALWSGGVSYRAFGDLEHSVRTGTPAFEHLFGTEFFDYLSDHPEVGERFDDLMAWNTRPLAAALAARDFSRARTVVDLGGGRGELLAAVLAAHPHLHGVLVDRRVSSRARSVIADAGVASRCELVECDIVREVPPGGDVYLLKSVLHGLEDGQAVRVLEHCRRAMTAAAALLVIELVLPDGSDPSPARLMDLLMLVGCHGRERSQAQFEALFGEAGFDSISVRPAAQAFAIIEARSSAAAQNITR